MQHSPEFEKLTLWFFQDLDEEVSNEEEMFRFVLAPFKDPGERARLRAYLDDITQDGISDEALQKLWWSSSADIVFRDTAYLRSMLRELRDRL